MENGDSINTGLIQQYYCPGGYSPNPGGALAIPWPDSPSLYLLFISDYEGIKFPTPPEYWSGASTHLFYHVIDMTRDSGLGAVVSKHHLLIADTMARNSIEACRHANGRDWWVLVPVSRSNCYYISLVTPMGVQPAKLLCTGVAWNEWETGQSFFTPDRKKFIRYNHQNGIHLYDFDNATGLLLEEQVIKMNDYSANSVGASVSPNSRFLYISMVDWLFQFDLQAPDIAASRVLLMAIDNVPDPFVPTTFTLSALAPDGKIYISGGSSHLSLHVVHRPDCPGLYSLPERRGLKLSSWNYFSIPNLPSYRNSPSSEPCESIYVHTHTPLDGGNDVVVYPNPATDVVQVLVNHPLPAHAQWALWNAVGQKVREINFEPGQDDYQVEVQDLPAGLYFYTVLGQGQVLGRGKLLIQGR
ncbi:MAG: T9SS type A sorting domain-containing protein [Saprospiraceae bacterium]|nr:T9SS type A sorting domain-containing protein [Saprospiraceae bacterium]